MIGTMKTKILNISKDFSRFPAGRFLKDGSYSGEAFRVILARALKNNERVLVEMDGTAGYGSSFLEEAFGGLVRVEGITSTDLRKKLELDSEDMSLVDEVWEYIEMTQPSTI